MIFKFSSSTKVERSIPIYFLPYIDFSTQTLKASASLCSGSESKIKLSSCFSLNFKWLFILSGLTPITVAKLVNLFMLSKKAEKLATKDKFSKELQRFTEKLMAKLTMDMQNKKPVNQSEYYTLTNLLKYLPELAKSKLKEQPQIPKPTGQLSEDFVKQIEKEFFGID